MENSGSFLIFSKLGIDKNDNMAYYDDIKLISQ